MSNTVISVEHLTKKYDLGVIGTGTLSRDLERWWARIRYQPDPYTKIGQKDAFNRIGESILAMDDVSFTVEKGEALGIIGRNGAGKSTLLKILSRVTAPTSGKVKVKGRIGSLLEVGTGFHPELTGRENIYLNGAILGMKKAEVSRKFDAIVDFSGVEKFIDTPVKRYSSGMYVRLAFAVAAHLDPEILIVDEVLAVGDADFQKKCLGKMGDVASEGRTVLFVSHNMSAIMNLCNSAILLDNGKIIKTGPSKEIVSNYLNKLDNIRNYDIKSADDLSGDMFVKFLRIRFINCEFMTVNHFVINEEFGIEITYEILQSGPYKPIPDIFVRTRNEEKGFLSYETHLPNKLYNKGVYKSIVWIPANLLNNETYIINVGLVSLNPNHIHCEKEILIEVEDDESAQTRGDYKGNIVGILRPLLKWEMRRETTVTS